MNPIGLAMKGFILASSLSRKSKPPWMTMPLAPTTPNLMNFNSKVVRLELLLELFSCDIL